MLVFYKGATLLKGLEPDFRSDYITKMHAIVDEHFLCSCVCVCLWEGWWNFDNKISLKMRSSFSIVEASLVERPRSEDNMAAGTFEDDSVSSEACGKYWDSLCYLVQHVVCFNH